MISNTAAIIFIISLLFIGVFLLWIIFIQKQRSLLHKLFVCLSLNYSLWAALMLLMWLTPSDHLHTLQVLDAITYLGTGSAAFYLMIALAFVKGYEKLPYWNLLLLITPVVMCLIALTNDWHHLMYKSFSLIRSQIVFGPCVLINGIHTYGCLLTSFILLINFARHNPSRLYTKQCSLLISGAVFPLLASITATFSSLDMPITLTPLSFLPVLLCDGIAIYRLNLLDITPIATQHVLDWISDCYLILSEKGLVISFNRPFAKVFAARYGIAENRYLKDCIKADDVANKTAVYNMMTALEACRESQSTISYEQAATNEKDGVIQKNYYVIDVSPLEINDRSVGYAVIFKDITQLKKSMQQLQESEKHMMEQERFAFLGQMIGGLAHNLKTPIMSISGCISAADTLIDECLASLDDPQVNNEDYKEIYGEIRDWFDKIREASAYMSDIITAIKGQATNVSAFDESEFTLDELIKRTTLLMRHELVASGCILESEGNAPSAVTLRGDINNLVQVMGNLLSNAIYAQKQVGGGKITIGMELLAGELKLYVKDTGNGIPPNVKERLFREMVTSKGAFGSGLGLYISNAVVRGKFGGCMWAEDNPGGGAVIGMTIPLNRNNQEGSAVKEAADNETA